MVFRLVLLCFSLVAFYAMPFWAFATAFGRSRPRSQRLLIGLLWPFVWIAMTIDGIYQIGRFLYRRATRQGAH